MKAKKIVFVISLITTILSFVLAVVFHMLPLENSHFDFLADLWLGIFSGAFLSTAITIVEYFSCRKKNLEGLFNLLCNQRYEFNKIEYFPEHICTKKFKAALHEQHVNEIYKKQGLNHLIHNDALKSLQEEYLLKDADILDMDYNDKIDIVNRKIKADQDNIIKQIDDVIVSYEKVKYKTYEIGNIIADSSFLFNNKKIKYKLSEIYQFIRNIEEEHIVTNFHFNNYTAMSISPSVAIDYITKIQKCFFRDEREENAVYQLIIYSEFAQSIDEMLDYIGFLCYGKKYKPCSMEDRAYLKCAYNILKIEEINEEKSSL